jgi:hypothetical protein
MIESFVMRALAGCVFALALVGSCAGAQPAAPPAPALVLDVAPDASSLAPEASAPPSRDAGSAVSNVDELLRAIRPNAIVDLEPGTYDLGAGPHVSTEFVRWESVHDGEELVVEGVSNLTLRGRGGNEDSELYGSGTIGVGLTKVEGFSFERSTVHHCTYGIARIDRASDVLFRGSRFVENGEFDLVNVTKSPGVRFEDSTFANNRVRRGYGHVFFKIDADSSVVLDGPTFTDNDFEQLTDTRARLTVRGERSAGVAQKALAAPSPLYNQIYALARYQRWIVAATQAGVAFWDPGAGRVDSIAPLPLATHLVTQGRYLWASGQAETLRFDGLRSKAYLRDAGAHEESLFVATDGKLLAYKESGSWWAYDELQDRFNPVAAGPKQTPATLGGGTYSAFYDAIARRNGEVWGVDFMRALVRTKAGSVSTVGIRSSAYPGSDPRRLYEDPRGQLWAIDFHDGFLRYDDPTATFARDPTVTEKASDVVVDVPRGRTWLLHYTKGVFVVTPRGTQFVDLKRLEYMRALLLDADGSVWVAGWNGLVHLEENAGTWRQRDYVVDAKTVSPTALP